MFLFIVRRYNDIDHIVPIVWKMACEGDGPLSILCTDPFLDIDTDFRIRFLRDKFHVKSGYLTASYPRSLRHRVLSIGPRLLPAKGRRRNRISRGFYARQTSCCTEKWAKELIETTNTRAIIVDWCKSAGTPVEILIAAANSRKIPVVSVPHGVNYMTNDLRTLQAVESGNPGIWGAALRPMDYVIVQHRRHGEWLSKCGVEEEKILIMGSTRFCREWLNVLDDIVPPSSILPNSADGKLKLVYLDSVPNVRLKVPKIVGSLDVISKLDFVDLIIKPTTAGNKFSSETLRAIAQKGEAIHSNELIDWADVVMGTTTSMLLGAFLKEKPLLYPKYFHENNQLFDEMGACLTVEDEDSLIKALRDLHAERGELPYPKENVDAFLTEVLYGGRRDRDVLSEYRHAVLAAADGCLAQAKDWEPLFAA